MVQTQLGVPLFLVPDFCHQLLSATPLASSLCSVISGNPPASSGLLPKMGEGGLLPAVPARAHSVHPGPGTTSRPPDLLLPPFPSQDPLAAIFAFSAEL